MLVSQMYGNRPNSNVNTPVGIKQTLTRQELPNGKFYFEKEYYLGNTKVEEPKKIRVYGRFFPLPHHKFQIKSGIIGHQAMFNQGSEDLPGWIKHGPIFQHLNNVTEYIKEQTTRIHLQLIK